MFLVGFLIQHKSGFHNMFRGGCGWLASCRGTVGSGSARRVSQVPHSASSTHNITAECRPRVQNPPRRRVVEKSKCLWVAHAHLDRLATTALALLGLGAGELDLPAE